MLQTYLWTECGFSTRQSQSILRNLRRAPAKARRKTDTRLSTRRWVISILAPHLGLVQIEIVSRQDNPARRLQLATVLKMSESFSVNLIMCWQHKFDFELNMISQWYCHDNHSTFSSHHVYIYMAPLLIIKLDLKSNLK